MTDESKINRNARMHALGDAAVTIEFGQTIGREVSDLVLAARTAIVAAGIPGVREYVPTFRSLTVHFDPAAIGFADLTARIGGLDLSDMANAAPGQIWTVPVVYDGPDLAALAQAAGLSAAEAAALHASADYHVYMLGFLPGFAYLGDLPEPLRRPRLEVPRTRVPAGSVAVADTLTAIYPVQSPGGWHLIGRTPLCLFDHLADPPSLFAPGDSVRFRAIDAAEFERQSRAGTASR
jgi:inhibitor of KinA